MRKNKQGMSVGVISLIMIFVVFLLASLAVLSLTTATANARVAKKALVTQTDYYTADAQAQETLAKIDGMLKTTGINPEALTSLNPSVIYYPETGIIVYDTKINEMSTLRTELLVSEGGYKVVKWQTLTNGEWQTKESINDLWKGN